MRKPVGVASGDDNDGEAVAVVVCSDGSVWVSDSSGTAIKWKERTPIPGTQRSSEKGYER